MLPTRHPPRDYPNARAHYRAVRVLHVIGGLIDEGNGITNSTVDLAALSAGRHDVAIASAGGDFEPMLRDYGVTLFPLDQRRTPLGIGRAAINFRRIVANFDPDIVHAQMMTGAVLARALRLRSRYQLVTTVHNEFQRSAIAMGVGDLVTTPSGEVAKAMARRGIPAAKLRVVSIGALDGPRRRRPADVAPADIEHPAIVTVAGLFVRKGIDVLIAAFERTKHPSAHLYIVGNGPDRAAFEAQARASDAAARIHFTGFEPRPERYMRAAEIFVLASRKEPSGTVLCEAREAGCAIVASDVGGIPGTLDDGAAGILVPPGDVPALARALDELLGDRRALDDARARTRPGLERWTAQRYCDEMEAVYAEALHQ